MSDAYRPRIPIDVTPEQAQKIRNLIPWGLRNQVFNKLIDNLIHVTEKGGVRALAGIIDGAIILAPKLEEQDGDD